jgi:hypothetical protein
MTTATFQKGDRVEFKEFPEVAAGKIVGLWKRGFYKGRLGERAHLPGQDHHRERECYPKGRLNPYRIGRRIAWYGVAVARRALAEWTIYDPRIRGTGHTLYISQNFGVLREGCANLCPPLRI